jgi:hypothetical protein
VDQKGAVVRKAAPNVSPADLEGDIDRLLAA